jgi:uncharacterized protein with PIN domain
MLGYDTAYYRGEEANPLIKLAREEGRVILTRNTKLLPKRPKDRIIQVIEVKAPLQVKELLQKKVISLKEGVAFSRCLLCNLPLDEIPRDEAEGKVPDYILYQQKTFSRCPQCLKIYWQGSHQDHMQRKIEELSQPS